MPATHLSLHYHLVFGSKHHAPLIDLTWRGAFHAYIGGVVRTLGGAPETIGGVADHVQILAGLRGTHCLADTVWELKAVTSRWVHGTPGVHAFAWQEGYGAFTVSASQRDVVRRYIANQEQHHRKQTFQEKYLELLERDGVEFDPRYVF